MMSSSPKSKGNILQKCIGVKPKTLARVCSVVLRSKSAEGWCRLSETADPSTNVNRKSQAYHSLKNILRRQPPPRVPLIATKVFGDSTSDKKYRYCSTCNPSYQPVARKPNVGPSSGSSSLEVLQRSKVLTTSMSTTYLRGAPQIDAFTSNRPASTTAFGDTASTIDNTVTSTTVEMTKITTNRNQRPLVPLMAVECIPSDTIDKIYLAQLEARHVMHDIQIICKSIESLMERIEGRSYDIF